MVGVVKEITTSARIIRADGTIIELGDLNYWSPSLFKRLIWKIRQWLHHS